MKKIIMMVKIIRQMKKIRQMVIKQIQIMKIRQTMKTKQMKILEIIIQKFQTPNQLKHQIPGMDGVVLLEEVLLQNQQ